MTNQFVCSVVIPTVRRPEGLTRAVESVLAQEGVDRSSFEVLIVDNDPAGSARKTADQFKSSDVSVRYVHEPEAGVATARNTAVANVHSELILFLDDDQTAPTTWVADFLDLYREHKPAIAFGPVVTVLPDSITEHRKYLESFFSRTGPKLAGMYRDFYGCGNSMLDLSQLKSRIPLFETRHNETGGEDDILYSQLSDLGYKFGWSPTAYANEHVPERRATLAYAMRRTFAYGQAPTTLCARKERPDIPGMIYWTMVGLGQTLVYGGVASVMWLFNRPDRAFWLDRAAQGLGKALWFGPFEQKFYGSRAN